jgi:hypothetical protein
MAARSVYTLSRGKQWQYALRIWLPTLLMGLLFVGVVVLADWIIPGREAADTRGAVTRHGSGVVTSFFYESAGQSGQRPPDQVNIALNGTEATYKGTKFLLLRKGQRVKVTYRMGKSGNIYVGDITPEGEAKP